MQWSVVGWSVVKCCEVLQHSDGLSNKVSNIIRRHIDNMKLLLIYSLGSIFYQIYEVCSNSIRIGIVVVVLWVGCVCNQSWHVRTCLSNSWHTLQVAAFVQLAVAGHGSNTCVYVSDFYDVWKYRTTHLN